MAAAPPALQVDGLVRRYGERKALAGVSFSLDEGRTLAVFGANGAGKSTLLRVLATLLRPHAGTVRVLGRELPGQGWKVRGEVGLLTHEPLLYGELTVQENLLFHARLHRVEPERIAEVLEVTGLTARRGEPVRSLSRGLIQRAAICRAVLHRPRLLLLDEPYANLDPAAAEAVEPLIGRSAGVTRVLISHDVQEGLQEADEVLGLLGGRVALHERADTLDAATIRRLYRAGARQEARG